MKTAGVYKEPNTDIVRLETEVEVCRKREHRQMRNRERGILLWSVTYIPGEISSCWELMLTLLIKVFSSVNIRDPQSRRCIEDPL